MRGLGARRLAALFLAAAGLGAVGEGAWIHAKAELGQALIARAWREARGGGGAARPWPWADTRPVARLQVPGLGVEVFVLDGGVGRTLAWGPGHLAGTARVGGPGNAVVGGHRDTHFAFLRDLRAGAAIRVQTPDGAWHEYTVADHFVTHDRDTRVLADTREPRLTLVTCWPFDAPVPGGPERYVVVAVGQTREARPGSRALGAPRPAGWLRVASRSSAATRGAAAARE